MGAVLLFLRGVPLLAYVCGALFLGLAYERHEATHYRNALTLLKAENAGAKIEALQKTVAEEQRRNTALRGEVDASKERQAALVANDAALTARVGGLSGQLAAVKRRFSAAGDPAAPVDIAAARAAVGVLTDMLGAARAADRARAGYADRAAAAGEGCERQYDSLTPTTAIGPGLRP